MHSLIRWNVLLEGPVTPARGRDSDFWATIYSETTASTSAIPIFISTIQIFIYTNLHVGEHVAMYQN